jgi:uncharacterized membrane protein YvbJ
MLTTQRAVLLRSRQGSVAWEKVITWVLAIIVFFVLIAFLVVSLANNPETVVGRLFAAVRGAGT